MTDLSDAETKRLQLRGETIIVAWSGLLIALFTLSYCSSRGLLLLYGDAVAHLHIARRLIDSINPGLRQLGSVWLPLPHLLLVPFVWRMSWWQSGLAGAFPSMGAYVFGSAGIYRLARIWLKPQPSIIAVVFFALNPGLLYMQTTAMNEPLFLAEMIWSVLLLVEFARSLEEGESSRAARHLIAAGIVLVGAIYTRYDGWIFAAFAWLIALYAMLRPSSAAASRSASNRSERNRSKWMKARWRPEPGGAFLLFTAMLAVAPLLWMAYCSRQFGDPLDFMRGPYSARAIDLRTSTPGSPHYPGWHSMPVAALYFLKAAELGAVPEPFADLLLLLTAAGSVLALLRFRTQGVATAMLLWIPLPFYAYSLAYGSVPIFIPPWWPHSWYNTRYGMELLPAFALSLAFLAAWIMDIIKQRKPSAATWTVPAWTVAAFFAAIIVAGYVAVLRATPLVLQEAIANSRTRIPFETGYARALADLPPQSTILAYTSEHIGAFQRAGIRLRRTINESDYYQWQPALADPARAADYVATTDNDPVAKAVAAHPAGLTLIDVVCSTGQPCARIYRSDRRGASDSIPPK